MDQHRAVIVGHCRIYREGDLTIYRQNGVREARACSMSRVITFLVGLYGGVYISQNYQIPILPGPLGLWEKVKDYSKNLEKKDKD